MDLAKENELRKAIAATHTAAGQVCGNRIRELVFLGSLKNAGEAKEARRFLGDRQELLGENFVEKK